MESVDSTDKISGMFQGPLRSDRGPVLGKMRMEVVWQQAERYRVKTLQLQRETRRGQW